MKIGVIANDAGGANALNGLLLQMNAQKYFLVEGPAAKIFKIEGIDHRVLDNSGLQNIDTLFTSTSSINKSYLQFIKSAKLKGVKTVAVLDHWVNYIERFVDENGLLILPDEIVCLDEYSERQARRIFVGTKIVREKNFYVEKSIERIIAQQDNSSKAKRCVLYLSNGSLGSDRHAIGEQIELVSQAILLIRRTLGEHSDQDIPIVFRPHPTDSQEIISKLADDIFTTEGLDNSLESDIAAADLVIGGGTMALYISFLAGKKSYLLGEKCGNFLECPINQIPSFSEL